MPDGWVEKLAGGSTATKKDRTMKVSTDKSLLDQQRGSETILFVEDEDSLRAVVADFLSQLGYRVLSASHGNQALEIAQTHPGSIHLLLTDVIMPGMSGPELAARLLDIRPETKVVYVSGYAEPVLAPHGVMKPGTV